MHMLNLGNANMHLIHMPSDCWHRNKSVNWLRPKQLQGRQTIDCWPVCSHTSCMPNRTNTFYEIRLCTAEKECWRSGAIFCLKSKSYLGFTERFAKVEHGAGENPYGIQESCRKPGANSASIRNQTLAGSKMWKIKLCWQSQNSWVWAERDVMPQLPSYGRRYLQRGWSTQISWLHSTRGAFLTEQKTWNGEVKH